MTTRNCTTSETKQLLEFYHRSRDKTAQERLVRGHLALVRRLCNRFRHSGEPMEDLMQVGTIGLLKTIEKYDPSRGDNFVAFAVPEIVGEIKNYFRDHGWAVKIPRKLQRQRVIVDGAVEVLSQRLGRSPTIPEITHITELSEEEVYDTFEVEKRGKPLSLEAKYERDGNGDGTGGSSNIMDYLVSEDADFEKLIGKISLADALRRLDERAKKVIHLRFYEDLSQTESAKRLGISQMHVSRLERKALAKLKHILLE